MVNNDKLKQKLLHKLNGFMETWGTKKSKVRVESIDHGTGKMVYLRESFQVLGKLFNIELVSTQKLEVAGTEFFIKREHYMVQYNSRSKHGGYYYYHMIDIAKALGLSVEEVTPYFDRLDELSKLTPKDISKAKDYYLKRIQKSADKMIDVVEHV